MDAKVYDQSHSVRRGDNGEEQDELEMLLNAHRQAVAQWRVRLKQPQKARQRTVGAVLLYLKALVAAFQSFEVRRLRREVASPLD